MFPSKLDIQFFYEMGIYTEADLDFYVSYGTITEEEKEQIISGYRI